MKALFVPLFLVICCLTALAAGKNELSTVKDAKVKKELEAEWIFNKSLKMTAYYPTDSVMKKASQIMKEKGIKDGNVGEMLYYSLDGGRHVLFIQTNEKAGAVRYHCIGFEKDENVKIYWVQSQPSRTETKIEIIQTPAADQAKADKTPGDAKAKSDDTGKKGSMLESGRK